RIPTPLFHCFLLPVNRISPITSIGLTVISHNANAGVVDGEDEQDLLRITAPRGMPALYRRAARPLLPYCKARPAFCRLSAEPPAAPLEPRSPTGGRSQPIKPRIPPRSRLIALPFANWRQDHRQGACGLVHREDRSCSLLRSSRPQRDRSARDR